MKRQQQSARRKSKKIILAIQNQDENTSDSEHSSQEFCENSSYDSGNLLNIVEPQQIEESQEKYESESQHNSITNLKDQVLWDKIDGLNDFMDDSSGSDTDLALSLEKKLSEWALQFNVTLTALTYLVKILRQHGVDVPEDGRTLLKTPRSGSFRIAEKSGTCSL